MTATAFPQHSAAATALRQHPQPPRPARTPSITSAVLETLAYADVFDWAMTALEVHRYLPRAASAAEVQATIDDLCRIGDLERVGDLLTLRGRAGLVALRADRTAAARALWPAARWYARVVAGLPFVRMVAVTGSLAVDAVDAGADVDLLVVTTNGRLWLTRLLTMAVVRAGAVRGVQLCPNYFLAEGALEMDDRSLFTAHEIAQMRPITASPAYRELIRSNAWVRDYLPNATPGAPLDPTPPQTRGRLTRLAEAVLRSTVGTGLERWEMRRKIRRLSNESRSAETRYDELVCKGHTEAHGRQVLEEYEARLLRLGVGTP